MPACGKHGITAALQVVGLWRLLNAAGMVFIIELQFLILSIT